MKSFNQLRLEARSLKPLVRRMLVAMSSHRGVAAVHSSLHHSCSRSCKMLKSFQLFLSKITKAQKQMPLQKTWSKLLKTAMMRARAPTQSLMLESATKKENH